MLAERDAAAEVDQAGERMERAFAVRAGLIELGGRCQQLLTRVFGTIGEPDYKSISEELGMPIGSIGPTRARCLAKLAEILKDRGLGTEDGRDASLRKTKDDGMP
jgi:DNA-directed RNA polymerase specialized sigma24 family protein